MYKPHPTFVLPENSDEKMIWRYMDLPKFINLIHKKSLFFTKTSKFSDPYEGTIPKYNKIVRRNTYAKIEPKFESKEQFDRFISDSPEIWGSLSTRYRELYLINSWHFNEYESAALWELYSTKAGIAIQSTLKGLKESFAKNFDDTIWIGAIKYIDYNRDPMNEWNILEAFVIKRPSFSHENEIRAITCLPDDKVGKKVFSNSDIEREKKSPSIPRVVDPVELTDNGKYVKVDLEKLINKVYVSPNAPSYFKEVVESIISKYGLSKETVKSDLYTLK
jgi:hypothetical protein